MRAVTVAEQRLVIVDDHPDPVPGLGEVLVRVHAAGLNGADLPDPHGRLLGRRRTRDVRVEAIGPHVDRAVR